MTENDQTTQAIISRVWQTLVGGQLDPGQTLRQADAGPTIDGSALRTSSIVFSEPLVNSSAAAPFHGRVDMDFEVLRVLGKGGMGVVYAARQAALEREVALKTPIGDADRKASVEQRFVAEAIVTAGLDHPNVVPVHELGRDDQGNLYMAMKLVQGTSWLEVLHPAQNGAEPARHRSLREHLEILLSVADAVAFAHSRGVVHRDLKPANVMLGDYGEVLVMDWGLAIPFGKIASGRLAGAPRVSAGTPSYMPPEMAVGDLDRLGPASDVYLLGAILYEILTTTAPHVGGTVWETLAAAAEGRIEPPDQRSPDRAIPRELSKLALKALSRDPAERHPTVAAFQAELRLFLAHEESLRLSDEAAALAESLAEPGKVRLAERYTRFGEAQSGFRQALHLWDGNEDAQKGLALVTERWASEALDRGDVGLAAAQAGLLAGLSHAGPARHQAIALAVGRRLDAGRRTRLAAVLLVVALGAVASQVAAFRARESEREAVRASERSLETAVSDAWKQVREDDVPGLTRALVAVDALATPPSGASPPWSESFAQRTRWFPWIRQVLVWQQGRWDEITPAEPPKDAPAPARPAVPSTRRTGGPAIPEPEPRPRLCDRLHARPEISRSALGRRIALACRPGSDLATDLLWPLLLDHARTGETTAIPAADEEWHDFCEQDGGCGETAGVALFRSAVWAMARDDAALRGDLAASRLAAGRVLPFALTRAPFGARDPHRSRGSLPRLVRQADATWLGLDARTGERLWQSAPVSDDVAGPPVPVEEDGSFVVLSGAQLVRLSGATGDVLGRVLLEEPIQGAWPDPQERSRLILLTGRPDQGNLRTISLEHGRPAPAPLVAASFTWPSAGWRTTMYTEAAGAWLGLGEPGDGRGRRQERGRQAEQDPQARAFVAERLRRLAERDPGHPAGWLELLRVLEPDDRGEVAVQAVEAARTLPVRSAVQVGAQLDNLALSGEADAIYTAAAERFVAMGGNADLGWSGWGPANILRDTANRLVRKGRRARGFELVETSRRFSTFMPGDTGFYRRYARWLASEGRPDEARRMEARRVEAVDVGGMALLSDRFFLVLDIALLTFALFPPILIVLLIRSWLRSRATRNADLHARGWRTAGQRLGAFLTHPFERLGFVFLRYAPRWERALLVGMGGLLLYYVCLLIGGIAIIGRLYSQPIDNAAGFPGADSAVLGFRRNLEEKGDRPFALRLLAEGERARGDSPAAAAVLQRTLAMNPDDPLALNNLAVLDEEQGLPAEARERYARAAALPGESGEVARLNLARLSGDRTGLERARDALAHRDRLRSDHFGETVALWALVPARDYLDTVIEERTLQAGARSAFREILTTSPASAILSVTNVDQFKFAPQLLLSIVAAAYVAWFFMVFALLWLPFGVRPLAAREGEVRFPRWRRAGRRLAMMVGFVLPGSFDLLAGELGLGVVMLFAFLFAGSVALCVYHGGLIWRMLWSSGYGSDMFTIPGLEMAFPDLAGLAAAATTLAVVVFAANAVLMVRRLREGKETQA